MARVEGYGVEPVPVELRTGTWRDLFAINFAFFLNPLMYLIGALAVSSGGLPLWWAVICLVLAQVIAFTLLTVAARPGVQYGIPGQVFTREILLQEVWGYRHAADTRLVNVHVQRLRAKVERDPERPDIVLTVRGVGYKAGPA